MTNTRLPTRPIEENSHCLNSKLASKYQKEVDKNCAGTKAASNSESCAY